MDVPRDPALDNFSIILSGTQSPGNIGSVARAMLNMGFHNLILVSPQCDPLAPESERMARDAWRLVKQAVVAESLREALTGFHYAVATTARTGKRREAPAFPRKAAGELLERAAGGNIALVFGPEDRGLSSQDVALCQQALSIPTGDFRSLNLSQAVLLICYELFQASRPGRKLKKPKSAPLEGQEAMFDDLQQAMLDIGYLDANNPEHIMLDFRRFLGRAGLTPREVRILRGLARQMKWAASQRKEKG